MLEIRKYGGVIGGVVDTTTMLKEFVKKRKQLAAKEFLQLQRQLLCEPIARHFEEYQGAQLHQYFLENGLFYPDAKIFSEVKHFEKKELVQHLESHYQLLKKEWTEAKATIYLFPVERRNEMIMKELKGRMGVSFHHVIVLFITKELSVEEVKALLTHEYNHVCRLAALNKGFHELSLLDSMIIEGMAEVAVEQYFGTKFLAPWVHLYSKEQLYPYWLKVKRMLHIKGKDNHDPILYGSSSPRGFPKWFGYSVGYLIVKAYLEKERSMTVKQLLRKSTADLLLNSEFDPTLH